MCKLKLDIQAAGSLPIDIVLPWFDGTQHNFPCLPSRVCLLLTFSFLGFFSIVYYLLRFGFSACTFKSKLLSSWINVIVLLL